MKTKTTILLVIMLTSMTQAQKSLPGVNFAEQIQADQVELPWIQGFNQSNHEVEPLQPGKGKVIYVNQYAQGANDGTSWTDAYEELYSAINNASINDELWVAKGTYKPELINSPMKMNFFHVVRPMSIYGGFAGNESSLEERDYKVNPTILSGDFLEDDIDGVFDLSKEDNAVHVVYFESVQAVIDGFEIAYGATSPYGGGQLDVTNFAGGILASGSVQVKNCLIRQNLGVAGGGGYMQGSHSIENCIIENNQSGRFGAGLVVANGNSSIRKSVFENNVEKASTGGGLFIFQNIGSGLSNTLVTIDSTDFLSNSATTGAGMAFNNFGVTSELNVDHCNFNSNTASDNSFGAGLFISNNESTSGSQVGNLKIAINDSKFAENYCDFGSGMYLLQEAGLFEISIDNNTFENNSNNIAGTLNSHTSKESDLILSMDNTHFRNNKSDSYAGGVAFVNNQNKRINYSINQCEFTNNDGGEYGGAIYTIFTNENGPNGKISNCLFDGNNAEFSCGAIASNNENLELTDNVFKNNSANIAASAVCLTVFSGESEQMLKRNLFESNITSQLVDTTDVWINNGAVEIWSEGIQNTTIDSCQFIANESPNSGGALSIINSDSLKASINNCHFNNNKSQHGGAMISLGLSDDSKPSIEISGSSFNSNLAQITGGGAVISNTQANINNTRFDGNNSSGGAGQLGVSNGTILQANNLEVRNGAAIAGGGVMLYETKSGATPMKANFQNCKITGNSSSQFGGGAYLLSSTNTIDANFTNCIFDSNYAKNGGGIYSTTRGNVLEPHDIHLQINNSIFRTNTAIESGGGIANYSSMDTITLVVDQSSFVENAIISDGSFFGGAGIVNASVGVSTNMLYSVSNSSFVGNVSFGISGGLWNSAANPNAGTKGIVQNCTFEENHARYCCGGLGVAYDEGVYKDIVFTKNSTEGRHSSVSGGGAAGFVLNRNVELINVVFEENESAVEGSALHMSQGGEYFLQNVLVKDHKEVSAVYNDTRVNLTNISLINNDIGLKNTGRREVQIQNSIFNNKVNVVGPQKLKSLGGNLCSNESMVNILNVTGTFADRNDQDPLLDNNGIPNNNSPCIDAGNSQAVTTLKDVFGNDRIQGSAVDIGAAESPYLVASEDILWNHDKLKVYPIPSNDYITITTNGVTLVQIKITSADGKLFYSSDRVLGPQDIMELNVSNFASGVYFLTASDGQKSFGQKIIVE